MMFLIVNPISSPRYIFGTVALGYLAALGAYSSLRRYRVIALSSVLGLLFLFPLLDTFRYDANATIQVVNPLESFLSGDYDSFAQINNAVSYVADVGATSGRQALGVLLFWVPRAVWPAKPVDTGILLAEYRGYGFTNLSAPLPAEFYINGGWAFLVIGMIAFGYAIKGWDRRSEDNLARLGVPTLVGCILPFYLLIVLRGSLLQAMAYLSVVLLCSWFITCHVSQQRR